MDRVPQTTARRVVFSMFLSSDHVTPATGKTVTVKVSKNGAAFANPNAGASVATEIGNGDYYFDAATADYGTLGPVRWLGTATSCDDCKTPVEEVVAMADQTGDSYPLLDTEVAAIKAKTDNLPTDPADASDIAASFSSIAATLATIATYIDTEVAAIKAKTDNLPSDPADQSAVEAAITAATSPLATAAAVAAIAADLPTTITKNTALAAFPFKMVDSADHVTAETGVTVTATRSLDGAAFAACANAATEIGSGWYSINLAAADLNANTVILKFTGTGCDTTELTIVTEPT